MSRGITEVSRKPMGLTRKMEHQTPLRSPSFAATLLSRKAAAMRLSLYTRAAAMRLSLFQELNIRASAARNSSISSMLL